MSSDTSTEALTLAALWGAIKAARRKHRPRMLDIVLLTMHPRDLYHLLGEDLAQHVMQRAKDGSDHGWTAFGIPVSERPVAGRPFGSRDIVLKRAPFVLGVIPKDWSTVTVQDMNQIVTEEF